jgi:hypothetical protein
LPKKLVSTTWWRAEGAAAIDHFSSKAAGLAVDPTLKVIPKNGPGDRADSGAISGTTTERIPRLKVDYRQIMAAPKIYDRQGSPEGKKRPHQPRSDSKWLL